MDYLQDTAQILFYESGNSMREIRAMLEDGESPKRTQTIEVLYQSILDKKHIDFDTIPKSAGDITKYTGYETMKETLAAMKALGTEDPKSYGQIVTHVEAIQRAINNLIAYRVYYVNAFSQKNDMLILEYNTFVYTCVEATTSLLYQYASFLRTPSSPVFDGTLKNTKYRADLFYVEQLRRFNSICADSKKYTEYLKGVLNMKGQLNFLGDPMMVGAFVIVTTVMLAIVPVTRTLIYTIQDLRGRLAQDLELQAYFLELNKARVQAAKGKTPEEKKKILAKQEKVRLTFLRLADKLRVKSVRAEELARKSLNNDNRGISLDSMGSSSDDDGDIAIL